VRTLTVQDEMLLCCFSVKFKYFHHVFGNYDLWQWDNLASLLFFKWNLKKHYKCKESLTQLQFIAAVYKIATLTLWTFLQDWREKGKIKNKINSTDLRSFFKDIFHNLNAFFPATFNLKEYENYGRHSQVAPFGKCIANRALSQCKSSINLC
jgi:hypothetical protein